MYHYTVFRDNQLAVVHICEECRQKQGVHQLHQNDDSEDESTESLLDSLIHSQKEEEEKGSYEARCDICGTTYRDVLSENLLGCAHCYLVFADRLEENGKPNSDSQVRYLKSLKRELKEAVQMELFEKAAEIRDKLKEFENSGYFE
jgi:protein arginine kinase activator